MLQIALEHETFGYLHDMMRPRFQELCAAEGGATEGGDWPLEACVGGLARQMDALVASTCEAVLADEASQESGDWQPVVMASTGQKALSKNIMAYVRGLFFFFFAFFFWNFAWRTSFSRCLFLHNFPS